MKRVALVVCLLSAALARADQSVTFSTGNCQVGWTVTVIGWGSSSAIVGDQCQLAQIQAASELIEAEKSAKTQCEARGGAFGPPNETRHSPKSGECYSYTLSEDHSDSRAHYCKCPPGKTGAMAPQAAPVDAYAVENREGLEMHGQTAVPPVQTSPLMLKAPAVEMR